MRSLRPACLALLAVLLLPALAFAQQRPSAAKPAAVGPPVPQSIHFPILLIAYGNDPSWNVHIGMKGPELLERSGYPPILLEPGETSQDSAVSWTYRATDTGTNAAVTVQLSREACAVGSSATKDPFRVVVAHAQIGTLSGCARISPDDFPEFKQKNLDDDDPAKIKPGLPPIVKFQSPVSFAYLNPRGDIVFSRGSLKKVVASSGTEFGVAHGGRRLLYTQAASPGSPDHTLYVYDFDSGAPRQFQTGELRDACWSPDDSHIAFLKVQDQQLQLFIAPAGQPGAATSVYSGSLTALHGWADAATLLATDSSNAYWIGEDGSIKQTVPLRDIYGPSFRIGPGDKLVLNPINPDLLLVSAAYTAAPPGAPLDSEGQASAAFVYELRSKRRVVVTPPDQWASSAVWSRDGIQVFYTRRLSGSSLYTYRVSWDGSAPRRYLDGSSLVIGQ